MVSMANYRYTMLSSPKQKHSDRKQKFKALLYRKRVWLSISSAAFLVAIIILSVYFGKSRSRALHLKPPSKSGPDVRQIPVIQADFKPEDPAVEKLRLERQSAVKDAFQHAWDGYKSHAWLKDEVKPLSGGSEDTFNGWAATLVDGLDTLWIMGFQEEFEAAVEAVKTINFTQPKQERIEVFENTIRYLGGLLGAYDVSEGKYPALLDQAKNLGGLLIRAFNTSNGLPVPYYWWNKTGTPLSGESNALMAQISSMSLEFTRLSQLTGEKSYFDAISRVTDVFEKAQNETKLPGLWPSVMDTIQPGFYSSKFTLGAWADSGYEYLIKEHVLLNNKTDQYLKMYNFAYETAKEKLFFRPKVGENWDLLFPGNLDLGYDQNAAVDPQIQHLTCFVGGMVGLGSRINKSPEQLSDAIKLTNTCVWAYQSAASGIMPEISHTDVCTGNGTCKVDWEDIPGKNHGFSSVDDPSYQLRPEAIESVFVMYRLTGDSKWQDVGWNMFQAIQNHTKTEIANAELSDVTNPEPGQIDSMESYFLAETLKYFFLLYSDPSVISLDDYVLNTEAHPLRLQDSRES